MAEVEEKSVDQSEQEKSNGDGNGVEKSATDNESDGKEEEQAKAVSEDESVSKLEKDIIRQVEYYFGDANLNRDKFLREQISKNDEGWVPLSVLLTFKRLSALTTDPEAVVAALKKSDEGLVDIHDDKTKLRRHPDRPIPEHNDERRKEIQSRTAYAKGFPLDATMNDILEFFAPFEKIANINMRKYHDKPTKEYKFKGSVFVTFETSDQAKSFIEKASVMYKERELIRKWQTVYLEEKKDELEKKGAKSKNKKKEEKSEEKEEQDTFALPKGSVLGFENAPPTVTRELLREAINKVDADLVIAFIHHSKGNETGFVRFQSENDAINLLAKLTDKKLKLSEDCELTVRVLEGEEESTYLQKAVDSMRSLRNNRKGNQKNKRKGGFNHNKYGKKKKANDDGE